MLAKISKLCPICRARGRSHVEAHHLHSLDMLKWQERVNDKRLRWGLPELDVVS
jgi:hypothetical protein